MQRVQYVLLLYDDDDNNDGLFEVATSNIRLRPKTTFVGETNYQQQHENVHIYILIVNACFVRHARMYALCVGVYFINGSIQGSNKQVVLTIIVLTYIIHKNIQESY